MEGGAFCSRCGACAATPQLSAEPSLLRSALRTVFTPVRRSEPVRRSRVGMLLLLGAILAALVIWGASDGNDGPERSGGPAAAAPLRSTNDVGRASHVVGGPGSGATAKPALNSGPDQGTRPTSTFKPDVVDPTHSAQWHIGGLAATFEPEWRMKANASGPVAIRGLSGEWTFPVLVYSDASEDIYIEGDAVEVEPFPSYSAGPGLGNLGWGNLLGYLRERSFAGYFVTQFNDPEITRSLIRDLQAARPEDLRESIHPELLKYRLEWLAFDLRKGTMKIASLSIHDVDGQFLAAPTLTGEHEISLAEDSRWDAVARSVAARLEQAKANPKVADGIERITGSRPE